MNIFALAVETRQYIRHILYPLLCQVNFSKFILCPRLRFYECEMGIIWKMLSKLTTELPESTELRCQSAHYPQSSTTSQAAI